MNLWFSIYDRNEYKGKEPYFFDPDKYQFSKIICGSYEVFNKELTNYLQQHKLQSYFNSAMVAEANSWKTISVRTWDVEIYENHRFFPETLKVINSIPGLVSASFNLLQPNGHIIPHCGDTNGIFRCHLGLSIPGKLPECGFRVGDEWRNWENGKLLVFVDAHNHEAINKTKENRYIFLFDIVREEVLQKKRMICATVLTSLFLQARAEKLKILEKTPLGIQRAVTKLLVPFAWLAIPVRNALYRIKK